MMHAVPLRTTSVLAVSVLLAAGLVTIAPAATAPAEAAPLPPGSETFAVSGDHAGASENAFLTPSGQHVVFTSTATDLVAGDGNAVADIFLASAAEGADDPFSGAPVLVSAPNGPVGAVRADAASDDAVASADGRVVAFTSAATNLVDAPSAGDGRTYVFVRDTVKDTTIRIQGPDEPNGSSWHPDLSDDGRFLVFTSDATNLSVPGSDVNGAADSFVVDLDHNHDGLYGDLLIERVLPDRSFSAGVHDVVISGSGQAIAYLSRSRLSDPADTAPAETEGLYFSRLIGSSAGMQADDVGTFVDDGIVGRASIDAMGTAFAYVKDRACEQSTAVVAASGSFRQAVGTILADLRSGSVADPVISADGSTVAWSTTVPAFDFGNGGVAAPPLAEPVIRVQKVSWWDAGGEEVQCSGILAGDWYDVAPGSRPSVSASGRTIAFHSPAPGRVYAVDRHSNEGISVSSVEGQILGPAFMTRVPIANIPIADLRGYAASLADSPIYRLPIYRLPIYRLPIYRLPIYRLLVDDSPIYRLPIYRLPIYRLPIYRLDLPGGWPQVLEGTPFAGELIQTVTLDEVLAWANENPQTDAGIRIRSLALADVGLEGSGLESLSLAAYALGNAPVGELQVPGTGSNLARWQALADAQGLGVTVDGQTVLAELDAAGLDVASTGIEQLSLSDLPQAVLDQTLLGSIRIDPALLPRTPIGAIDVSTLDAATRTALFGTDAVTGTLAAPSSPLSETATFADLAAGAAGLSFGDVLFSLLDAESYPWEQISTSAIDPRLSTDNSGLSCVGGQHCGLVAAFRFTFDAGPGEPTTFAAPTASITLPAGTRVDLASASLSGPNRPWISTILPQFALVGSNVNVAIPDTLSGTVLEVRPQYSVSSYIGSPDASATLTTGSQHADGYLPGDLPQYRWDDPEHNWSPESGWQLGGTGVTLQPGNLYYEWISPAWVGTDDNGQQIQGPADDDDYYLVDAPAPGKRLVISTNANDGQLSLSLYGTQGDATSAATLGLANAGPVPGTAVTEQSVAGAPPAAGADAGSQLPGQTLIDQVVQRGDGAAQVVAASADAAAGTKLLVRVTSGNGQPSSSMYSLRVQYLDESVETVCAPWTPAFPADPASIAFSDPVTADTNTLYLVDTARYDATYGVGSTDAVRAGLSSLTGSGHVGDGAVQGAVLSIDADDRVRSARSALDQNPCSMEARKSLAAAINTYVSEQVGENRGGIRSVVVVGGDDIIPFAPVAQHTSQFTEQSHAPDLRLSQLPDGSPCPVQVAAGAVDACATPLSAAAAASMILTDDPYGLAHAYESLGGYLYVPTTALGRLVETPDEILAIAARFAASDGVLGADSTLTAGYGAWSELPDEVTSALSWRSASNVELGAGSPDGLWSRDDVTDALFPAGGTSPRVVSINTHADEGRMLPGVPGAESGSFQDADLFTADDVTDADALAGSLVFLIGCHAGNNLPTAYYGADARDWVDVFSHAGGYVGNTGYGLANNITTALGERLLALYADWIGVQADGRKVSASEALTYAKQSYLGGLGLYSGYDEKVLMEAVYYGLPMYTFSDAATTRQAPVPEIPAALQPLQTSSDGLSTASLGMDPSFQKTTVRDAAGNDVSYLTANGEEPAVVAGQPVLPKIVAQLRSEPGLTPRGVLITGLESQTETGVTPAIAQPDVGVPDPRAGAAGGAFPSSFATITRQTTPTGPADFVVVTPGRVQAPRGSTAGSGSLERFTHLDLDVVYGPDSSSDVTPPSVSAIESRPGLFQFSADGTGSPVVRAILLLQYGDDAGWVRRDATESSGTWSATLPADDRPYRWILQVADSAGNVAVETNRGQLPSVDAPLPTLGEAGGDATVVAGASLRRSVEVAGATPGDVLTGRVVVTGAGGVVDSSPASVQTGNDGVTRAFIDQAFATPGDYTVTLSVCRASACVSTDFAVHVAATNTPPTASVTLTSSSDPVSPDSVLTAQATGSDADGDAVSLAYAWTRNGAPIADQTGSSLSLAQAGAEPGDVFAVTVTPSDPYTAGHATTASVTVSMPPAAPQIAATATTAGGAYVEGTWSRTAVTVSFACTGIAALQCTAPQTVATDTPAEGVQVTGTARDLLGRTSSVTVLVKVDATAPALAPTVTPSTVPQGTAATAEPHATDASSGVASQSCDAPQSTAPGPASVACRATDNAGNSTSATASYTVVAPPVRMCRGVPDRTALPPLNADGSSVFQRGTDISVSFRACDGRDRPITTRGFVKKVTLVSTTALPKQARVTEFRQFGLGVFDLGRKNDRRDGHGGPSRSSHGWGWFGWGRGDDDRGDSHSGHGSSQQGHGGSQAGQSASAAFTAKDLSYAKSRDLWLGELSTDRLDRGKRYTYRVLLTDGTSFTFTFGVK